MEMKEDEDIERDPDPEMEMGMEMKEDDGVGSNEDDDEEITPNKAFNAYDQLDEKQQERLGEITSKFQNAKGLLEKLGDKMIELIGDSQGKVKDSVYTGDKKEFVDNLIRELCVKCCDQTDLPSRYIVGILQDINQEQLYYQNQKEILSEEVYTQMNLDLKDFADLTKSMLVYMSDWANQCKLKIIENCQKYFMIC